MFFGREGVPCSPLFSPLSASPRPRARRGDRHAEGRAMCVIAEVQRCGAQLRRPKCASSHECVCGEPQRVGAAPVAYRDQSRGRAGVCPRRLLRPQELHCRARASVSVLCKPNHRRLKRPHGLLPTRPCEQPVLRSRFRPTAERRFKASFARADGCAALAAGPLCAAWLVQGTCCRRCLQQRRLHGLCQLD